MTSHEVVHVHEPSQVVSARAAARSAADRAGFDDTDIHRAGLVATELATNLARHARDGEILIRGSAAGEIEMLAIDRGPGMANLGLSMTDGHSTGGTPGTGLGAIRRLSDDFDIFSSVPQGTVAWTRLRRQRAPAAGSAGFDVAAISVSKENETVCGDAWTVRYLADEMTTAIVDGLGHGLHAAEASRAAVDALNSRVFSNCADAIRTMHESLRHTRGAAGTVVTVSPATQVVRVAGIGNVSAAICHEQSVRRAVSLNGILGGETRPIREFTYPWIRDSLLVMHSDGLASSWSLATYPGYARRHPAIIAALLYRDFNRGRDDVTVLVGREAA